MKTSKLIRTAAGLSALALVAVGCSKDKAADTTAAPVAETTAAAVDTTVAADTAAAVDTTAAAAETTAAATTDTAAAAAATCTTPNKVKLQLQWVTQAQFAGYFAAVDKGFYKNNCLDVEIIEGGVDIVPQTQLATGAVDYALAWVPKALASREAGAGITDVAQIFARSGTLQVSF